MKSFDFYVGFDTRMPEAYAVTVRSLVNAGVEPLSIHPLVLPHLQGVGMYDRPMHEKDGVIYDEISGAPNASEFSISRFMAPLLSSCQWAIFCDSDFLFRGDIKDLIDLLDPKFALMCVPHGYNPTELTKMRGQVQTQYPRKNWSSLMAFNVRHIANAGLTQELINTRPGRDLHRFCWLQDQEIGYLPETFNALDGHSDVPDPQAVHFTRGTPDMPGFEDVPFAEEWRTVLAEVPLCRKQEN